jgi:hypothetical protein
MNQELEEMLFKLKLQGVSASKIERDLGFSNGVLGKGIKGKPNLSKARFVLVKRYFDSNIIDDRSNPLINAARGRDENGTNTDELETEHQVQQRDIDAPLSNEEVAKVDYQKEFNDCEYSEEYKALWDKISKDPNVSIKDKQLWKIRLNAK